MNPGWSFSGFIYVYILFLVSLQATGFSDKNVFHSVSDFNILVMYPALLSELIIHCYLMFTPRSQLKFNNIRIKGKFFEGIDDGIDV